MRLVFGQAQRAVEQHCRRLTHRPHYRFHCVATQLFQRTDPLVAVDDYVPVRLVFDGHNHDGRLLPRFGQ